MLTNCTLQPLQLILPICRKCQHLALSGIYIHYQFTVCVIICVTILCTVLLWICVLLVNHQQLLTQQVSPTGYFQFLFFPWVESFFYKPFLGLFITQVKNLTCKRLLFACTNGLKASQGCATLCTTQKFHYNQRPQPGLEWKREQQSIIGHMLHISIFSVATLFRTKHMHIFGHKGRQQLLLLLLFFPIRNPSLKHSC